MAFYHQYCMNTFVCNIMDLEILAKIRVGAGMDYNID